MKSQKYHDPDIGVYGFCDLYLGLNTASDVRISRKLMPSVACDDSVTMLTSSRLCLTLPAFAPSSFSAHLAVARARRGKVLGAIPRFHHLACGDVFRSLDTRTDAGTKVC